MFSILDYKDLDYDEEEDSLLDDDKEESKLTPTD